MNLRPWQRYALKHPERIKEAEKKYRQSPLGKRKAAQRSRFRAYKITWEEYTDLVLRAAGYCEICERQSETSRDRELVIDHCHMTGKIRGFICQACNKVLGFMETHGFGEDWPDKAKVYLNLRG